MQGKCEVEGSALDARNHRVGSRVVLSADGDGNFSRLDNASEMLCAAASSFSRCESAAYVTRRRSAHQEPLLRRVRHAAGPGLPSGHAVSRRSVRWIVAVSLGNPPPPV